MKKPSGVLISSFILWSVFALSVNAKAQTPIGLIDFYGLKNVPKDEALSALGLKEGDTLTVAKDSLERRLLQLHGVQGAEVTQICCVEGQPVLFVGVREGPVKEYPWKTMNGKRLRLPPVLTKKYASFLTALNAAVSKGDNGDDLSAGHSLFRNPALKKIQLEFSPLADRYFRQLSNVLQHSSLVGQREAAATVIAYATAKQKVADQYYEALTDPAPEVRNNVFRALTGLGIYATSHPNFRLKLKGDLFVWLLNSPHWSDRDKALFSLMAITEKRDEGLLLQIKAGALPSLLEMAAWKSKGHAVLAYVLLGRMAGVPEEAIFSSWNENRKEAVLKRLQIDASGNNEKRRKSQ